MSSRILVLGLDAFPGSLVDRWVEQSRRSTLVALTAAGRQVRLESRVAWLPGAIWPELDTGVPVGRSGLYYHPAQFRTGEAAARPIAPDEVRFASSWERAARAGRRTCVLDAVQSPLVAPFGGLQVVEWGTHDRHFRTAGRPDTLLPALEQRHGRYPIDSCDGLNTGTSAAVSRLRDLLLTGIERKLAVTRDLLDREAWDLFHVTFSEAHCAGHQFWPGGARRVPAASAPTEALLAEALDAVAFRLDQAVAEVIDHARARTTLVIASHGMGPALGVEHLLPECLDRLGFGFGRRGRVRAAGLVPAVVRRGLRRLVGSGAIEQWQLGVASRLGRFVDPATTAVAVHNGATGAIRLNIAGREPGGRLDPGRDVDAVVDRLAHELTALRNAETGEPVVADVRRVGEVLGSDCHPDLPDVLVRFASGITPVRAVVSPRGWTVRQPRLGPRSGEHVPDTRLWTAGAVPGALPADVLDVAPLVLRLLGLDPGTGIPPPAGVS